MVNMAELSPFEKYEAHHDGEDSPEEEAILEDMDDLWRELSDEDCAWFDAMPAVGPIKGE